MEPRRLATALTAVALLAAGTACGSARPVSAAGNSATLSVSQPTATQSPVVQSSAAGSRPAPACSGFALSLVSDVGGQRSPLTALTWFLAHDRTAAPGLPRSGWRVVAHNAHAASVQSGAAVVHVVQGRDQGWQVDEGRSC